MSNYKLVYNLRENVDEIAAIQKTTLETEDFGLVIDIALFGSEKWWSAIDSGDIPVLTVLGKISDVYMAGHNDFPMFDIDSDGVITSWEIIGDDSFYKVGASIKLEYVIQMAKKSLAGEGLEHEIILKIFIDHE